MVRAQRAETVERGTGVRAEWRTGGDRQRWLVGASTLFTVAVLVHNFDHLRRGGSSVSAGVFWLGTLAIVNEVGIVVLAYMRHPKAPLAAVAGGFALAAGYVFVHFTPARSWLSDSFVSGHASPVSIFAASFETISALVLAVAGVMLIGAHDGYGDYDDDSGYGDDSGDGGSSGGRPDGGRGSVGRALRHPVVIAMIVGNIIVVVGSFATR